MGVASDRARRAREEGRTFHRAQGRPDVCVGCLQHEGAHVWVCDGCGEELTAHPVTLLPVLHVEWSEEAKREHGGATLVCPLEALS